LAVVKANGDLFKVAFTRARSLGYWEPSIELPPENVSVSCANAETEHSNKATVATQNLHMVYINTKIKSDKENVTQDTAIQSTEVLTPVHEKKFP